MHSERCTSGSARGHAKPLVARPEWRACPTQLSDTLYGGCRFRILNILDEGGREGVAIEIDTSLPSERVIRVLKHVMAWRGQPQAIRLAKGPEFIAERFMTWCAERGIARHDIYPGKPDQPAFMERDNRTYRTEVLNAHVFESLESVRGISAEWNG